MKLAIDSLQREVDAINAHIKHHEKAIEAAEMDLKMHKSGLSSRVSALHEVELAIAALVDMSA